jgi:hypothetical protein
MNFTVKMTGLNEVLSKLSKKQHVTVSIRTFNKVGDKVFTQSKRQAAGRQGRYNVKGGQKALGLKKLRANKSILSFRIKARTKPLSLMAFEETIETKQGVKATIVKGQRKTYGKAFIARPKGAKWPGQKGSPRTSATDFVFQRKEAKKNYPLRVLRGVSPWKMVNRKEAMKIYENLIEKEGPVILQREINYIMSK